MGSFVRAAQQYVAEAPAKVQNYARSLENDPARAAAGYVTHGGTEATREAGIAAGEKMAQEAAINAPKTPAMPGQQPTGPDKEKDSPKEDAPDARRGRASTILTGRRGLTTSPATARRTLMGV